MSTDNRQLEPSSGRGKELLEVLRRELQIPKQAMWFEVRFAIGEVVTVKCEYMPCDTSSEQLRPE